MKGVTLLCAVVFSCGLVKRSQATSCKASLSTCQKTLYVTGTCKSNVCECTPGYIPGLYGCQKQTKAAIVALPDFNGEIKSGQSVQLECKPPTVANVVWLKDGKVIKEISSVLSLNSVTTSNAGKYTCKSNTGVLTKESDPFTITVVTKLTKKPTVVGMPSAAVSSMKVKFTCDGGSIGKSKSDYIWKVNNKLQDKGKELLYSVQIVDAGATVECSRDGQETKVTFPAKFESNIAGVAIIPASSLKLMKGEPLQLFCDLTGGFPSRVVDPSITYEWKKGSTTISSANSFEFKIPSVAVSDTGSYKCEATLRGQPKKISESAVVTVKETMAKGTMKLSSAKILVKGHYSLSCDYETVNTASPVTYTWKYKDNVLQGVTDRLIQFNDVSIRFAGDYECSVSGADGTVTNKKAIDKIHDLKDVSSDVPTILIDGGHKDIIVGKTYSFMCIGTYTPVGTVYEWTVGTTVQKETTKTFKYTPKNTVKTVIKCRYIVDETASKEGVKSSITATNIGAVTLKVNGVVLSQSLQPVSGSKVKIMCDVEKAANAGAISRKWFKGLTEISGETKESYTLTAGSAGSAMISIKCEAAVDGEKKNNAINVEAKDTPVMPTIATNVLPYKGIDVDLMCTSHSFAEGATFEWKKNGKVIKDVTSYKYSFKGLSDADKGSYSCKITVAGKTSITSNTFSLDFKKNEVTCKFASQCKFPNMDPTICDNGKCKCKTDYMMKFGKCIKDSDGSGAEATAVGSLLTVMALILGQKLL